MKTSSEPIADHHELADVLAVLLPRLTRLLLLSLVACGQPTGAGSSREVVQRTLGAMDRGDLASLRALQMTSKELRTYSTCPATEDMTEAQQWAFLDQFTDAALVAAADHLKGQHITVDAADEFRLPEEHAAGAVVDEICRATRAFAEQDVDLSFFLDGEDERMSLTVGRFDGRWRLVFVKYGRGFNY